MNQTILNVPFAHLIEPISLEYLRDEVDPAVWDRMHEVFEALAVVPYKGDSRIGSFYIVFHAPFDRANFELMHADQLYARYDTKFYNEEIHLITPKQ